MKIWMVDDDVRVQRLVTRLLGNFMPRAEVALFHSPLPALAALATESPDLVLMDGVMPGMSGPEAVAELRRRGWTGPVIEMHGYLPADYRVPPGSRLLMKPFQSTALLDLVSELVGEEAGRQP